MIGVPSFLVVYPVDDMDDNFVDDVVVVDTDVHSGDDTAADADDIVQAIDNVVDRNHTRNCSVGCCGCW